MNLLLYSFGNIYRAVYLTLGTHEISLYVLFTTFNPLYSYVYYSTTTLDAATVAINTHSECRLTRQVHVYTPAATATSRLTRDIDSLVRQQHTVIQSRGHRLATAAKPLHYDQINK